MKKAFIAGSVWYEPLEGISSVSLEWLMERSNSLWRVLVSSLSDSLKKLGLQEFFTFGGTDGFLKNPDNTDWIYAVAFLVLKEEKASISDKKLSSLLEKVKKIEEIPYVLQIPLEEELSQVSSGKSNEDPEVRLEFSCLLVKPINEGVYFVPDLKPYDFFKGWGYHPKKTEGRKLFGIVYGPKLYGFSSQELSDEVLNKAVDRILQKRKLNIIAETKDAIKKSKKEKRLNL